MRYSTKQEKDSGIFTIFVERGLWEGRVRHNFWEIWRGGQSEFAFVEREYCVIFLLAKLIFRSPPPLLIIIAQSLIVEAKYCSHAPPMRNPRPFFNLFDVHFSSYLTFNSASYLK